VSRQRLNGAILRRVFMCLHLYGFMRIVELSKPSRKDAGVEKNKQDASEHH
jgi:hypothetical protein